MRIFYGNFGTKIIARCGFLEGKYNFPEYIHQFAEIVYCDEGSMELTVDGKTEVMESGDLAVIAPFRVHSFHTPEYVRRWICVFSDSFVPRFVSRDEFLSASKNTVFHPDEELMRFLRNKLPDNNERNVELNLSEIRTMSLIVSVIYEDYLRKVEFIPTTRKGALAKILLYINEHMKDNLTLAGIGSALGYSPKYVSNCISSVNNTLPLLLNSLRVDYAKHLLINTDLNVIDIGMECGYNNEKSFYRAFRSITGTTPAQYRRKKGNTIILN